VALQTYYSRDNANVHRRPGPPAQRPRPRRPLRGPAEKVATFIGAATPRENCVHAANAQRGDQPGGPQFGANEKTSGPAMRFC